MCDMCSSDEQDRIKARRHHQNVAAECRRLSLLLEEYAAGKLKPHTNDIDSLERYARTVIQNLVADWL